MIVFSTGPRQQRALIARVEAVTRRMTAVATRLGLNVESLPDPNREPGLALDAAWGVLDGGIEGLLRVQLLHRVAVDLAAAAVVGADADGRELFRTAAVDRVLGPNPGRAVAEEAVRRVLHQVVESGEALEQEVDIFGPPRRALLVRAVPVDQNGKRAGVASIVDISEKRRINAFGRDFVANISHELRTPIGALAALSETITAEDDPATIRRLAGRLEGEAHRLTAMVDDLLALSRIEGEEPLSEIVSVSQLVREAVDRAQAGSERRGVKIRVEVIPATLLVEGDRAQLVSALHNLLENALKYSDKDVPVVIGARADDDPSRAMTAVWVRDWGMGIPVRDQERIFERFYRVDRARTRDTGGTGLGLAIVRHVAVNHDGDVQVESLEGEGSTFTLRIPRLHPEQADGGPTGEGSRQSDG